MTSAAELDATAFRLAAAALEDAGDAIDDVAGDVLGDVALAVQANVQAARRRHRRTGKGERLVSVRSSGSGASRVLRVHAGGRVAHLITGGTAPHSIRPLARRALSLAGGLQPFAASVRHPGTQADPFVARGVAASRDEVDRLAAAGAAELADDLATVIRRT